MSQHSKGGCWQDILAEICDFTHTYALLVSSVWHNGHCSASYLAYLLCTITKITHEAQLWQQGCCRSLKVESHGIISTDFQGLESPWKQTLNSLEYRFWRSSNVLEFDFLKCRDQISSERTAQVNSVNSDWHCAVGILNSVRCNWIHWQLLMHLVNFSDNSSFWLTFGGVKLSCVNWTCLYMLIKVPVWVNLVLVMYPAYGPW